MTRIKTSICNKDACLFLSVSNKNTFSSFIYLLVIYVMLILFYKLDSKKSILYTKKVCIIKPIIGITSGDPSGIGPEIAIKALQNKEVYQKCVPVIISDYNILNNTVKLLKINSVLHEIKDPCDAFGQYGTIDYINTNTLVNKSVHIGTVSIDSGKAAFSYIIYSGSVVKTKKRSMLMSQILPNHNLVCSG